LGKGGNLFRNVYFLIGKIDYMKPYGREKKIKGCGKWKLDYHVIIRNKKIGNWWEDMNTIVPRSTIKQNVNKEINEFRCS